MYFQCPSDEDVDGWTEEMIWEELQRRLDGPDGFQLKRGHIFDKMVLRFRSYVCEPLRYGNLFLAGDAGHTVPPTGAKGLNLAFADVRVLFEGIESWASTGSRDLLDQYSDRALQRIWKAQNFSYWMTSMLHERADANPFERKRQLGELERRRQLPARLGVPRRGLHRLAARLTGSEGGFLHPSSSCATQSVMSPVLRRSGRTSRV